MYDGGHESDQVVEVLFSGDGCFWSSGGEVGGNGCDIGLGYVGSREQEIMVVMKFWSALGTLHNVGGGF